MQNLVSLAVSLALSCSFAMAQMALPDPVPFPGGTFETFTYPGYEYVVPSAINRRGVVVGSYGDLPLSGLHGFLRSRGGRIVPIDAPGMDSTRLEGVNWAGWVLGSAFREDGPGVTVDFNFVRSPWNHYREILLPGDHPTTSGMSPAGEILGRYVDPSPDVQVRGFLRTRWGRIIPVDVPAAIETVPEAANSRRRVVGRYQLPGADGVDRGFLWSRGRFVLFDIPGAYMTRPTGITRDGTIVGTYKLNEIAPDGRLKSFGFVITPDRTVYSVEYPDDPSVARTGLTGVNERGTMVGYYVRDTGEYTAFILR